MPANVSRRLLPRQANVSDSIRPLERRMGRIAEVFEDLATESVVELLVYEDFLDLNPQVREFPNLGPEDSIISDEVRVNSDITQNGTGSNIVNNRSASPRRTTRRDFIRGYRLR